MELSHYIDNNMPVLAVSGVVNSVNAEEFNKALLAEMANSPKYLILDLGGTKLINSIGLRCLLAASRTMKRTGGRIIIRAASGEMMNKLETTGFNSVFQII